MPVGKVGLEAEPSSPQNPATQHPESPQVASDVASLGCLDPLCVLRTGRY